MIIYLQGCHFIQIIVHSYLQNKLYKKITTNHNADTDSAKVTEPTEFTPPYLSQNIKILKKRKCIRDTTLQRLYKP